MIWRGLSEAYDGKTVEWACVVVIVFFRRCKNFGSAKGRELSRWGFPR